MGNQQSHGHSHGSDGQCDDDGHGHSHAHGGHSHSHGGHSHGAHAHPDTKHMVLHVAGGHALLGTRFPSSGSPQLELVIMDDLPIVQDSFPTKLKNTKGQEAAVTLRKVEPSAIGGSRFLADVEFMTQTDKLAVTVTIIIDGEEAEIAFEGFQPGRFAV